MPTIIGSTTVTDNSAEAAASTALPPPSRTSAAAADASGWLVTAMPRDPTAGRFSQANGVGRDRESVISDIGGTFAIAGSCGLRRGKHRGSRAMVPKVLLTAAHNSL